MNPSSDTELLLFTVAVALGATVLMAPFGVALGWVLARWRGVGRSLLETLCLLPLVLPPTAVGLLLLTLLSADSPLGRLLAHLHIELLFTWRAVVLASAVMGSPLLIRAAKDAFLEVDPRLFNIARTLGDGPWRAFRRVALPLALRGILGGLLLAFARALGEFGATILIAGNIPGRTQTLSLAIFERVQTGEDNSALRLLAITVVLAFLAVGGTELLQRRKGRAAV